jgi:hypothetical protein
MDDIIQGEWEPRSLGAWIDLLIIRNIRMWHLQERVYDLDALLKQDRTGLETYLKDATWMNLQRNTGMDQVDTALVRLLFGDEAIKLAPAGPVEAAQVWESMEPLVGDR